MSSRSVEAWKALLRSSLTDAMKARRAEHVSALRQALAAIDNAEAADASLAPAVEPGHFAGGVAGLGAGDVARRQLSPQQVEAIIRAELDERRAAAAQYRALERPNDAARLEAAIDALEALLTSAA